MTVTRLGAQVVARSSIVDSTAWRLASWARVDVQQDYGSAWLGVACPLPFRSAQVGAELRPPLFVEPQESALASQPTAARC
eukprot:CAMPEP_0177324938 /NCGR_PEP_ID=MMETSP0368-20130122/17536_1 /TAXON_ID=447022 ORGANISM="Scrippsiella hangoei-like, Strain SHHI-4" /NCGR_SAMPLE_ID=MMETSP0368 /ASSEMBLY_ACC=CAM_ASM_000363 /LENGTH=80 /DNA_ID=CAMNT_0018784791 /DNA_START=325 /DNA_END=565 /DNA_ORIENTATION=-